VTAITGRFTALDDRGLEDRIDYINNAFEHGSDSALMPIFQKWENIDCQQIMQHCPKVGEWLSAYQQRQQAQNQSNTNQGPQP